RATAAALPRPGAAAGFDMWNATSGNWSNPQNWLPQAVPGDGDSVTIFPQTSSITVTYDYAGPPVTLLRMDVYGAGGTHKTTISQSTGVLTTSNGELIGNQGQAAFIQSGG